MADGSGAHRRSETFPALAIVRIFDVPSRCNTFSSQLYRSLDGGLHCKVKFKANDSSGMKHDHASFALSLKQLSQFKTGSIKFERLKKKKKF